MAYVKATAVSLFDFSDANWTVCCRMNARLKEIELNDDDSVKCFKLADGSTIEGDLYVSAMPGKQWAVLDCKHGVTSHSMRAPKFPCILIKSCR